MFVCLFVSNHKRVSWIFFVNYLVVRKLLCMFLLAVDVNVVLICEEDVIALSVIPLWMMRWRGRVSVQR